MPLTFSEISILFIDLPINRYSLLFFNFGFDGISNLVALFANSPNVSERLLFECITVPLLAKHSSTGTFHLLEAAFSNISFVAAPTFRSFFEIISYTCTSSSV